VAIVVDVLSEPEEARKVSEKRHRLAHENDAAGLSNLGHCRSRLRSWLRLTGRGAFDGRLALVLSDGMEAEAVSLWLLLTDRRRLLHESIWCMHMYVLSRGVLV